jgi:hypothetical protein
MKIDISKTTAVQLAVLESASNALNTLHNFELNELIPKQFRVLTEESASFLGMQMKLHHAFTTSAFSKFAFEHGLFEGVRYSGGVAELARQGNPGYDIAIAGEKFALKTEAAKNSNINSVHISKWMELGKNATWGNLEKFDLGKEKVLIELAGEFVKHLGGYDRILVLRHLSGKKVGSSFSRYYELIEIPKEILLECLNGRFELKMESRQFPKPGYCYVTNKYGNPIFSLYFDGGGERKLQIKHLDKSVCIKHASWEF